MSDQERLIDWFRQLTPENQKEVLKRLADLTGIQNTSPNRAVDYRRLYFDIFYDLSKAIDMLIETLRRNEEVHMNQTEIVEFPSRQELEPEK